MKKIEVEVNDILYDTSITQALMKQQRIDLVHKTDLKGEINDIALVKHRKAASCYFCNAKV